MPKEADFGQGGLLGFWNSMSVDERTALVKNLEEFHATISSLKGQNLIETDKHLTEITLLKLTPDTKELFELRDKVHAQGIKILYKNTLVTAETFKKIRKRKA